MADFFGTYPPGGGGGGFVSSVADTDSIDLTVAAGVLEADLKLSAAAASAGNRKVTNTIETDGLLGQFPVGNLTAAGVDGIAITTGTGAVVGTGTSIAQQVSDATHNGYLSSADWVTFNAKQAALTIGNLSAAGTDGIAVTGGTGAVIGAGTSIAQQAASGSQNGYLTSADWSTFNGKQGAGNYITALTGNVTASGPGSVAATIANNVITNAMVNSAAAIDYSKLAALTSANILVGSAGNVATVTPVTGDISITNGGVTAYAGTVPINKGGTGQTTQTAAFDALSPLTTKGDLITYAGGDNVRQAVGANGTVLTADSAQTNGMLWSPVTFTRSTNTSTPGTNQTLTSSSAQIQYITPSAAINYTLDNSFTAGQEIILMNLSSSNDITVKANDASTIFTLYRGTRNTVSCSSSSPSTNTSWKVENVIQTNLPIDVSASLGTSGFTSAAITTGFMERYGARIRLFGQLTVTTTAGTAAYITFSGLSINFATTYLAADQNILGTISRIKSTAGAATIYDNQPVLYYRAGNTQRVAAGITTDTAAIVQVNNMGISNGNTGWYDFSFNVSEWTAYTG